ncbi:MAG: glycosyltransferase family 4 protein, partial [Abditibacteriota bacterium]|nr:glycosyltransferase family 4 protein [Abditibacteriota bacterium]
VGEIVFTGMLDHTEITPYLMAADVFAFPSVTDTQGIAVAEAMSAALPCVSMNAGGIPENMTDGVDGFLCENNVESYSGALRKLFDDPDLRRKMGENAKKDSARFSVGGMIDRFEEFYSKALYEV